MKNTTRHSKEHTHRNHFRIILIRGLESIEDNMSLKIGKILGVDTFNSDWYGNEDITAKTSRLDHMVQEGIDLGQKVAIIGISAGAGLGEYYMLRHPHKITLLYSLLGVLQPDIDNPKIVSLSNTSNSFREMTTYLYHHLTPETIYTHHLDTKIIVYSTLGDKVVPYETQSPAWIKVKKIVGKQNHIQTIIKIMLFALYKRLSLMKLAKKNYSEIDT